MTIKRISHGSPSNHDRQEVQVGTAIHYYAVCNDGFFGSLPVREAAHRPENEDRIRGMHL